MTPQKTIALGNDAQVLLENDAYKEAFTRTKADIIERIEKGNPKDAEGTMILQVSLKLVNIFHDHYYGMIRAGEFAQYKIDLEAARAKPRGRVGQYLRQVSR